MKVAAFLPISEVNGPGRRSVLWLQGCPIRCVGCHNQDMWDPAGGHDGSVEEVVRDVLRAHDQYGTEGLSLSGGEPTVQAVALTSVCRRVRQAGLSIMMWTGYEIDYLLPVQLDLRRDRQDVRALLDQVDILVTGPFRVEQADPCCLWRGSRNQTIHLLTDRYGNDVLRDPDGPAVEVHLVGGRIYFTGLTDMMVFKVKGGAV